MQDLHESLRFPALNEMCLSCIGTLILVSDRAKVKSASKGFLCIRDSKCFSLCFIVSSLRHRALWSEMARDKMYLCNQYFVMKNNASEFS